MKKILIAGATGYLGHFVTQAFKKNNYYTKVLVRNPEKFRKEKINADEVISAEITQPETLVNVCNDVDTVFSSVGITRQKEGSLTDRVDAGWESLAADRWRPRARVSPRIAPRPD